VRNIRLEVPEIPEDEPSFSQPMYVWNIDTVNGEKVYHPNPPRLYGLYKDTLTVFLELYLPDSLAQEPTFEFKSFLVDGSGENVSEYTVSLPNPGIEENAARTSADSQHPRTYPVVIKEDLTKLPAGSYSLLFSFGLGKRTLSRVRGGAFSVAWDIRTWETARRSFHAEARFLLGDKEYAVFAAKSAGEQEQMLDALWRSLDPTPETGVNEAYEKFMTRLAYVNDHFSGYGEAINSDRGQIYLKWGNPNEVVYDVIPANRETLAEAMEVIDNRFHWLNLSTGGSKLPHAVKKNNISDTRKIGKVGEGGNVGVPYELWIYDGSGDPILERDRVMNPDIGMRYLFVDREGYGRYRLESSSSISDK
jgi:GWxTD domain-containing protein